MQPYFTSFADFIAMGKHGTYVWICWGVVVGSIFLLCWFSYVQRRNLINQLQILYAQQASRYKNCLPNAKRQNKCS